MFKKLFEFAPHIFNIFNYCNWWIKYQWITDNILEKRGLFTSNFCTVEWMNYVRSLKNEATWPFVISSFLLCCFNVDDASNPMLIPLTFSKFLLLLTCNFAADQASQLTRLIFLIVFASHCICMESLADLSDT